MNTKNTDETVNDQPNFEDALLQACRLVTRWPEETALAAKYLGITTEDLEAVAAAYQKGGQAAVAALLGPAS